MIFLTLHILKEWWWINVIVCMNAWTVQLWEPSVSDLYILGFYNHTLIVKLIYPYFQWNSSNLFLHHCIDWNYKSVCRQLYKTSFQTAKDYEQTSSFSSVALREFTFVKLHFQNHWVRSKVDEKGKFWYSRYG